MAKIQKYYVYTLTDPRDLKVFYIGKGTANRSYAHTHSLTTADGQGDTPKAQRVREILEADEQVVVSIVKRFEDEADAYQYETDLINATDGLTNSTGGGGGGFSHQTNKALDRSPPTPKQNAFALRYIELGNASRAYRETYNADGMSDNAIRVESCRLLQHPNVSLIIEQAKAEHMERHNITIDGQSSKLEDLLELAHQTAQPSAGVSAVTIQSKLHGLLVERQQVDMTGDLAVKLNRAKQRINNDDG